MGESRGEDPLPPVLPPSRGPSLTAATGGLPDEEEEEEDEEEEVGEEEGWEVMEAATMDESSERQMSPSWEQKEVDFRRKASMPPAVEMSCFFSSGRRERLSLRVMSSGLSGPWVLKISAKNLPTTTHTHHTHIPLWLLVAT